jgi:hypothetical protein
MSKRKLVTIALVLVCCLLLAGAVQAMSSANYALRWFTPLTGGGGGVAASANYGVNLTVGQTAIGATSSAGYGAGLGYWYGMQPSKMRLPLVLKSAP